MSDQEPEESDLAYLKRSLRKRTTDPVRHFPFLVFVFVAIVLFRRLGVWFELLKLVLSAEPKTDGLIVAAITFFPTDFLRITRTCAFWWSF